MDQLMNVFKFLLANRRYANKRAGPVSVTFNGAGNLNWRVKTPLGDYLPRRRQKPKSVVWLIVSNILIFLLKR